MSSGEIDANELTCPSDAHVTVPTGTAAQQATALLAGWHTSYVYAGPEVFREGLAAAPSTVVIAFDAADHPGEGGAEGGVNVLFADGSVEWFAAPDGRRLLNELAAGHNPPRSTVMPPTVTTAPAASGAGR